MEIKVLASGSSGNCYRISNESGAFLIECGLTIRKIKEGLNFRLSEIDFCLISHSHQ
jgi:phosphoribosyl 1,2-cyclic phosphodiesterase